MKENYKPNTIIINNKIYGDIESVNELVSEDHVKDVQIHNLYWSASHIDKIKKLFTNISDNPNIESIKVFFGCLHFDCLNIYPSHETALYKHICAIINILQDNDKYCYDLAVSMEDNEVDIKKRLSDNSAIHISIHSRSFRYDVIKILTCITDYKKIKTLCLLDSIVSCNYDLMLFLNTSGFFVVSTPCTTCDREYGYGYYTFEFHNELARKIQNQKTAESFHSIEKGVDLFCDSIEPFIKRISEYNK